MILQQAPLQLALDLPVQEAFGVHDFIEGAANAEAMDLVRAWPGWLHWGAVVVGPAGSGKSHLAHVWAQKSGAGRVSAASLREEDLETLKRRGALVVEDLHAGIGSETVLFHMLNLARQEGLSVLSTSRHAPGELGISLPDLRSRLRALPIAHIHEPDELLLRAVLVKLFADRQLMVEPKVVNFLVHRIERSMAAAQNIVRRIDGMALALRRNVTVPLAHLAVASEANSITNRD